MCFYEWGQLIIDGFSLQFLAWIFVALFAILLNGAIVVAGWSILSGTGALYVLVLMVARIGCFMAYVSVVIEVRTIDTIASLIVWLIDIPATLGRIIWNWWCKFQIAERYHVQPIMPFKKRQVIGSDITLPIPRNTSHDEEGQTFEEQEDVAMNMAHLGQGTANVFGIGDFASTFLPTFWTALKQLNAISSLRTIGELNIKRPGAAFTYLNTQNNVRVISPTKQEIENVLNESASVTEATNKLVHRMVDREVEANVQVKHPQGHVLFIHDMAIDRGILEKCMRELKTRQPQQGIFVFSSLPHVTLSDSDMLDAYTTLLQLRKDGTAAGTILLDARGGGYALTHGEERQELCAGIALASLLVAHTHHERNQSYTEIIEYLGRQAPLFSMAFASACFVSGPMLESKTSRPRRSRNFAPHGLSKLNDALVQARVATEQVLGDSAARCIDEPVDVHKPLVLIYTVPIDRADPCWSEFTRQMRIWLAQQVNSAIPVFVSGSGFSDDSQNTGFFLQVSAIYPLPHIPAPLQSIVSNIGNAQNSTVI
jgi:hypothetical protein